MSSDTCVFCRIAQGELAARKIHEDDDIVAFHDHQPNAPVHFLIIPKRHINSLQDCGANEASLLGTMLAIAPQLAAEQGCRPGPQGGFRVMINSGADGGQEVSHLHLHVLGGPRPWRRD